MNISLILGHPQPGSLNHAIAETALALPIIPTGRNALFLHERKEFEKAGVGLRFQLGTA